MNAMMSRSERSRSTRPRSHGLAAIPLALAVMWIMAGSFTATAMADTDLGGVDLDGYCRGEGYERVVLLGPPSGAYAAYNWKCEGADGRYGIDMQDVCRKQKANPGAYGTTDDLDSAYSWRCYLPGSTGGDDTSCLPDNLFDQVSGDPAPGSPLIEPTPSSYGEGEGAAGAAPTGADSPGGPESDPCAWRGTFRDGFTLAGQRSMVSLDSLGRKRGVVRLGFTLKESVPWQVCLSPAAGSPARCAAGGAGAGARTARVRVRPGRKQPNRVLVRFRDMSSGALQSYRVAFKGRRGTITQSPVSLATATVASSSRGNGYPDGVGDWLYGNTFSEWIDHVISKNWWVGFGFKTCLSVVQRYWFIEYYKREQQHIRDHFSRGYNLGRPSSSMRIDATGFGNLNWRFYQLFNGGSWGPSTLTAPRSQLLGDRCSQKPHLITGAIYRKWSQIGHVRTMGGPLGGQYRDGPFIRQNFERGQIGFRDGNTGTVWYRYGNGPWRT